MKSRIYFCTLAFLSVPFFAFAHDTGYSYEQIVGNYLFDIGYSIQPVQGELVRFDLSILNSENREPLPFTSAWVRIEKEGEILFAGPIHYGQFGKPGFSYVFPESGDHAMYVRFEKDNDSIQEGTIQILVSPAEKPLNIGILTASAIMLILGLIVGFFGAKLLKK